MQALEPLAGDELERQLARYARVRLDPTPAQSRRARAALMEAAWRRRLDGSGDGRARGGLFASWSVRRLGASLAAAVLAGLLIGSTTFAASRAGGPLYEARLTLETLTLPSDPGARLDAELALAQSRLAEAVDAAGRGDNGALSAALAAYDRTLDDLAGATGQPADRALEAVQFHRDVLQRLIESASPQALGGLENAFERSNAVIDRLDAAGPNGGGNGNGNGNGNGSNAGGNGNGQGPAASPGAADPTRTPGPAKSPKPTAAPASPAMPSPGDQGQQGQG